MFWEEECDEVQIEEFFTIGDADEIQHLMNSLNVSENEIFLNNDFSEQQNINETLLFPIYREQAA